MAAFPPVSAPQFSRWERKPNRFVVTRGPEFADGGVDTFLSTTTPIRVWEVFYATLTLAEAQILDDWYDSNFGEHTTFNFTDRDSTVYGGVRCVGYERNHNAQYATTQWRRLIFEDRP